LSSAAPPATSTLRQSLVRFAAAADSRRGAAQAADGRVCAAGSAQVQDLAEMILGPTTFGRAEVGGRCTLQISALVLDNPTSLPLRCDISGREDRSERAIVRLAPGRSMKLYDGASIGGELKGGTNNRWTGRIAISCGHDPDAPPPPQSREQAQTVAASGFMYYRDTCSNR
jgi:hypothetical protein